MNNERRILYISVAANFIIGIIIGIILFYGQMRIEPAVLEGGYTYDKSATLADFFRLSWLNTIWLLSIFLAHCILPLRMVHPIIAVRGCVSSFSILYILTLLGIKEAVAAVIPQCLSVLPMLAIFSVETTVKYRENIKNGYSPCSFKRYEIVSIFMFSGFFAHFCSKTSKKMENYVQIEHIQF